MESQHHRCYGFTLVEVIVALTIVLMILGIGMISLWGGRLASELRKEAVGLQRELEGVRVTALRSTCPRRVIPCKSRTCAPGETGSYSGFAIQVYCKPGDQVCNAGCSAAAVDGYDNWDFEGTPQMLKSSFEYFRILGSTTQFDPKKEDDLPKGLVFPTDPTQAVMLNGDPNSCGCFVLGLAGASNNPIGQPGKPGYTVVVSRGGVAELKRGGIDCAAGSGEPTVTPTPGEPTATPAGGG